MYFLFQISDIQSQSPSPKLNCRRHHHPEPRKQNMFDYDISAADVILLMIVINSLLSSMLK